jgi:pimeloyl-ACP methyl ester carboxylesterase
VSAQCGTLPVPENRATGTGKMIQLRVAVVPALDKQRAPDPVFWLAGGPGDAATDSAAAATGLMATVNQQRDLVLVDQRGTGGSNDLRCPQGSDASRWAEELRTCLQGLDGDPRAYTTAWAMDDLDDVRAALGYDRINLYGISYGVTAAQVYLQRHPSHVRTVLLESGTVLGVPVYERFPAASQHALDLLFTRCAADPGCHAAYPDPAADLRAVTARLDRGPIDTKLTDPSTGQPIQLNRQGLGQFLLGLLSDLRTAGTLPRMLRSAARGDWNDVIAAVPRPPATAAAPSWQLMPLTIQCHEPEERLRQPETEAAAGSFLSYTDMRAMLNPDDICATLPAPQPAAIHGPPPPHPYRCYSSTARPIRRTHPPTWPAPAAPTPTAWRSPYPTRPTTITKIPAAGPACSPHSSNGPLPPACPPNASNSAKHPRSTSAEPPHTRWRCHTPAPHLRSCQNDP